MVVTPALRQVVAHPQQRYPGSERRACRVMGLDRSNPVTKVARMMLCCWTGYTSWPMRAPLRLPPLMRFTRAGWLHCQHKRVYRLYRQQGLLVRKRGRENLKEREATGPNRVYCYQSAQEPGLYTRSAIGQKNPHPRRGGRFFRGMLGPCGRLACLRPNFSKPGGRTTTPKDRTAAWAI